MALPRDRESARPNLGDVFITNAIALPQRRPVRHTNRLTNLPGCHRFILRAGPWSWARREPPFLPPALLCRFLSLDSTTPPPLGLLY